MASITLRSAKGAALTNAEVDANFSNINSELGNKVASTEKGAANGVATLNSSGLVPASQLPPISGAATATDDGLLYGFTTADDYVERVAWTPYTSNAIRFSGTRFSLFSMSTSAWNAWVPANVDVGDPVYVTISGTTSYYGTVTNVALDSQPGWFAYYFDVTNPNSLSSFTDGTYVTFQSPDSIGGGNACVGYGIPETGAKVTAVGYGAGSTVTTGQNLTLIGYKAQPSSATATNEATIGNSSTTKTRLFGVLAINDLAGTSGQVLTSNGSSSAPTWQSPASAVSSVAGRTGAVTLSYSDISGLGDSATKNIGATSGTVAAGDHNHTGTYEPVINKSTGILTWNGSAWVWDTNTYLTTASASSTYLTTASAASTYEPAISKSTGFLKWNGSAWAWDTSTYLTTSAGSSTYEPVITAGTTAQYWRGDKSWQTLNSSAVGLGSVENTALSTWAGTSNITTVGTIATGMWNATAIADGKIASALTGKTYNGLTLTAAATGFTVAGGTTSKTLTVSNTLTLAGTDAATLNIGGGGTLGSAAFTASSAYQAAGTYVTSVGATAPVASSGGTAPTISMAAANSTTNGYMTSTYAAKLDGIAAGATNVTNTNQLTNGAGFITSSGSCSSATTFSSTTQNSQFNSIGVNTSASGTAGEIRATNNITAYYSDSRLKDRISVIDNALAKVRQLTGFLYRNNALAATFGYDSQEVQVGLSAQDALRVQPEAVAPAPFDMDENNQSKSGENYLTIRYERLVPLLVEAIKELAGEVDYIKARM